MIKYRDQNRQKFDKYFMILSQYKGIFSKFQSNSGLGDNDLLELLYQNDQKFLQLMKKSKLTFKNA